MPVNLITFKNSITVELNSCKAVQTRADATIARMRQLGTHETVAAIKAEEKLERAIDRIDELEESLAMLNRSDFSELKEFNHIADVAATEQRGNEKIKNTKKAHKTVAKKKKKDETYRVLKKQRRSFNWDKKKYRIYYNKFLKALDTLPNYMTDNLKTMPNNKGYLWRGVQFLGKRNPIINEPLIVFEKRRGVLMIRKQYKDRTEVHKKTGKETKLTETIMQKRVIEFIDPPGGTPPVHDKVEKKFNNRRGGKYGGNRNGGGNRRGGNGGGNRRGGNGDNRNGGGNRRGGNGGGNRRGGNGGGGNGGYGIKTRNLSSWAKK
jgi:hypothetical protein